MLSSLLCVELSNGVGFVLSFLVLDDVKLFGTDQINPASSHTISHPRACHPPVGDQHFLKCPREGEEEVGEAAEEVVDELVPDKRTTAAASASTASSTWAEKRYKSLGSPTSVTDR